MLTTVERLIDGVVQTLTEAVLPDVATPFARGQLYAAVDVLAEPPRPRRAARGPGRGRERLGGRGARRRARRARRRAALCADAASAVASRIRSALASAPAAPPATRTAALRAALVEALTAIAALPDDVARPARAPIAQHLGAQAMRDVAVLKPSMLGEISRG